jgi:6-pyruvoyl-tetrahydropterin synthase
MSSLILSTLIHHSSRLDKKKIIELLEKDVFISINKKNVSTNVRIFDFRFVNEIKHSDIETAFEKFRLVNQTFNNQNKIMILIQSSIIQQISQRLMSRDVTTHNTEDCESRVLMIERSQK